MEPRLKEMMAARRQKVQEFRRRGINPYGQRYIRTHSAKDVKSNFEALEGSQVSVAGRIMSKRTHGKAGFMHIQDASGRIQIYGSLDALGEEAYDLFKKLDVGDIVGVQGEVFITKTGEISIRAGEVTILAKCLRPLPEKWHGLRDVELRYRQRYLDLIVNPGVQRVFLLRSSIIRAIREFLDGRGFIEVETPAMHVIPGGAAARPFVTHHNALDMDLYLRIALELHLKRLLVGGLERVYEIGRVFRNEGISTRHNPEFTMLELYQSYSDYHEMMELTEQLLCYVANRALGTAVINYQGNEIDLTPPWPRITLTEIISRYTGVDITRLRTEDDARREAERLGLTVMPGTTRGKIINEIFENLVEPRLISPTFVVDYPVDISPLAKRREDNPELTYRFEAFVAGMEVANAFSELNDPDDQRERFLEQARQREKGDQEAHEIDEDFLRALEYGMPPAGGLGIGIDRIVMILTDSPSIREVILFPTLKVREEDREDL